MLRDFSIRRYCPTDECDEGAYWSQKGTEEDQGDILKLVVIAGRGCGEGYHWKHDPGVWWRDELKLPFVLGRRKTTTWRLQLKAFIDLDCD